MLTGLASVTGTVVVLAVVLLLPLLYIAVLRSSEHTHRRIIELIREVKTKRQPRRRPALPRRRRRQ